MADTEHIQLAHGGGGQLTAELIEQVILPAVGGPGAPGAGGLLDAATLTTGGRVAFTTDSYVVQPLEFPGGDIGKLAVCGTVNDLAVVGAVPEAISLALVIQEGLAISLLRRVLVSAGDAARQARARIVTGDTKVVGREGCDGLIINTAGLGRVPDGVRLGFDRIAEGDRIVLSGPLGEHGLAVVGRREGLSISADLASDCASICGLTRSLLDELGAAVKFMRDPTRGGLAATVCEIAAAAGRNVAVEESAIPVNRTACAVAEMLGLDLLAAANEGKLVAVVSPGAADEAVAVLAAHRIGRAAAVIGTIGPAGGSPLVEMTTHIGGRRIVQMPYGQELPRIC